MASSKFDPAPVCLSAKLFMLSRMRKSLAGDDFGLRPDAILSDFDLDGILRDIAVIYRRSPYAYFCEMAEQIYEKTRGKMLMDVQTHFMAYYIEGPTTDSLESLFLHLEGDCIKKLAGCDRIKVKTLSEMLPEFRSMPELYVWSEKASAAFSECLEKMDYKEFVDSVMRNYAKTPGVKIAYTCMGPPYDVWDGHPHWKGWCDEVECRCQHNMPADDGSELP